jgi:hypothetical protein
LLIPFTFVIIHTAPAAPLHPSTTLSPTPPGPAAPADTRFPVS